MSYDTVLATATSPAPAANKSQKTPLRTGIPLGDKENHKYHELTPPYLLPEEDSKAKHPPATTAQTEQSKKHNENQCEVGGEHGNEGNLVALHVG
jgi:hypothetical protein